MYVPFARNCEMDLFPTYPEIPQLFRPRPFFAPFAGFVSLV